MSMQCPNCHSDKLRRSTRHGLYEGMWLRLRHRAPYRCQQCHLRFVDAGNGERFSAAHGRSLASYLGLDNGYESGLMVAAGSLMLLVLAVGAILFVTLMIG